MLSTGFYINSAATGVNSLVGCVFQKHQHGWWQRPMIPRYTAWIEMIPTTKVSWSFTVISQTVNSYFSRETARRSFLFATCGPRLCKNRPDPFPGQTWYTTTKLGFTVFFLPRDAMLARYMLSSCVRLSVCQAVKGRYFTKLAKHRITETTPYDR